MSRRSSSSRATSIRPPPAPPGRQALRRRPGRPRADPVRVDASVDQVLCHEYRAIAAVTAAEALPQLWANGKPTSFSGGVPSGSTPLVLPCRAHQLSATPCSSIGTTSRIVGAPSPHPTSRHAQPDASSRPLQLFEHLRSVHEEPRDVVTASDRPSPTRLSGIHSLSGHN